MIKNESLRQQHGQAVTTCYVATNADYCRNPSVIRMIALSHLLEIDTTNLQDTKQT